MRIRILIVFKVMWICEQKSVDPPGLHFEPPKLLFFYFNADNKPDPDPAFHFNADPDPASKINADPDQQPLLLILITRSADPDIDPLTWVIY
jgi:hypothetical protein